MSEAGARVVPQVESSATMCHALFYFILRLSENGLASTITTRYRSHEGVSIPYKAIKGYHTRQGCKCS